MKKNYFLLIGLLAILLLMAVACSSSSDAAAPDTGADQSSASEPAQSGEATQEPVMESMTEGTGFCANDFYPLRSDKTWHYTIESLDQSSDYSITFKDVTDSSFTAMQTFPSLTNEITWQCSADGLLSSTFANMSFLNSISGVDISYETLEVNGVALPPDDQWQVGKTWDLSYHVNVIINTSGTEIQAEGIINYSSVIAAVESITVPAGTYPEAYRVDSSGAMLIKAMGTETSTPLVFSDWYVRDVGLVKSASSDPNLTYSMQLTAFE